MTQGLFHSQDLQMRQEQVLAPHQIQSLEILTIPLMDLQARINQLLDRVEAALKQALRIGATAGELPGGDSVAAAANLLLCYTIGRWQQYAKSGFSRDPMGQWPAQWPMLYAACLSQPAASSA